MTAGGGSFLLCGVLADKLVALSNSVDKKWLLNIIAS